MTLSVATKKGLVFGFGVALLLIGCFIGGFWTMIVDAILSQEMALSKSSTSFGMWEETPIPMEIQVHFFNWTNALEFEEYNWTSPNGSEPIPEFVEMGPYVFSEHHTKVNITWNDNNTVTFQQIRKWEFLQEKSNGSLEDEVTNLNVIAVTVEHMIRHMNPLVQIIVDTLVKDLEPLFVTKKVRELMFEGYEDELLNITTKLNVSQFKVPFDKFGFFYPRNNSRTYDGVFNMHTGTDDLNVLGLMSAWNYEFHPDYYDGNCGKITGYTGELFPPLENDESFALFAPELCSSLTLNKKESYSRLGVDGYKFVGDDRTFDNGTKYRDNNCYCAKTQMVGTEHDVGKCTEECMPSGVRGISKCRYGAPIFLSFPHFYKADPSYLRSVKGLSPNKDLHEFYLGIIPETGIPLDVKARMQINLLLQSYSFSKVFANMPKVLMPALWFTQSAEVTSDLADLAKLLINLPAIGMGTFFGLAGIGALLILAGIVITLRKGWKGDEGDKLLSDSFTSVAPTSKNAPSTSG
ncbi:hypothetical protein L9F63_002887 [Diploptera punctata]|uniref:Protein croquemort n=1 Tax=Diploptera punctata TaxID=6984 RepID=A0AAD7ZSE9_DIPPU|nr:hypothetical protein L9F63_002887 [Diploptera punctata]